MERARELVGMVKRVEDAFHGVGEVKDMIRGRVQSLESVLDTPRRAPDLYEDELERLKCILGKYQDLDRKHTAKGGDGTATKGLKILNRGLGHQSIRDELAKHDAEVTLLFGVITTKRALNGSEISPTVAVMRATIPAAAPVVRVWYVERGAIVADACARLGVRTVGDSPTTVGPRMVGLAGPGGAGKSTAASMVIARDDVREHFNKGVLWLPVGQGAKHRVHALMRQLATMVYEKVLKKKCRPLDKQTTGRGEEGAAYIRKMTTAPDRRRFLVVADDVWEVEVLQELEQAGVSVLYTTRSVVDFGEAPLQLTEVLEDEAESIFRGAAELPDDARLPGIAYELMKQCEYSALELAFIGRWTPIRGRTSAKAWQEVFDLIVNMQSCGGVGGQELLWKDAVLRAGLDELALGNLYNKALYLSLAVLPKGLAFSTEDAAALLYGVDLLEEDIEAAKRVVMTLERWSILTLQEGGKYRVHDSHAEFIQGRIANYPPTREKALKNWQRHISTAEALFAWPSELLADMWRAVARVKGEEGISFAANKYDAVLDAIESSAADAYFLEALRRVAHFQYFAELTREASQTWTKILDLAKALDPDHADVAQAQYYIGLCLLSAGNTEAAAGSYRDALGVQRKNGAHSLTLAYTYYCLGDCAMSEMLVEEAEKWYLLAYEARKGVATEPVLACNMIQIGWCCMHSEPSRLEKAEDYFQQALKIQERQMSPAHPHIRVTLSRLGRCLLQQGRAGDAEEVLQKYLLNCETYLSDDDKDFEQVADAKGMLDECARTVGGGRMFAPRDTALL